jgi:Glycosyltransferase family 87
MATDSSTLAARGGLRPQTVRWAGRISWQVVLFGLVLVSGPLLLKASFQVNQSRELYDFRGGLWNAGVAILHGRPFYQLSFLAHQVSILNAGGIARGELYSNPFSIPVYPAFANVAVVPLGLLPFWAAGAIWTLLSIAAMVGGLWLLGVRDWRCIAVALLSWPFLFGAFLGAVGPFLVLGAGAAWRWRERVWPCAGAVAAIVATKIFPWPLGVWLLVTRRWRAAAAAIGLCLALTLGAWALIGFEGLAQYPRMLQDMTVLQEGRAVSVVTVLVVAGVPSSVAGAVAIALALGIIGLAWRLSRRPGGDRMAFGLAVIAALTGTPIVWSHYMVLLFVPIALCSPRFSRIWLLPLVAPLYLSVSRSLIPDSKRVQAASPNALREALLWLALETIIAVWLCTTASQRRALAARLWPGRTGSALTVVTNQEGFHA